MGSVGFQVCVAFDSPSSNMYSFIAFADVGRSGIWQSARSSSILSRAGIFSKKHQTNCDVDDGQSVPFRSMTTGLLTTLTTRGTRSGSRSGCATNALNISAVADPNRHRLPPMTFWLYTNGLNQDDT